MGRVAANVRACPIGIGLGSIVPCLGTIVQHLRGSRPRSRPSEKNNILSERFDVSVPIDYHSMQHETSHCILVAICREDMSR